jgi:hypothetical protein
MDTPRRRRRRRSRRTRRRKDDLTEGKKYTYRNHLHCILHSSDLLYASYL